MLFLFFCIFLFLFFIHFVCLFVCIIRKFLVFIFPHPISKIDFHQSGNIKRKTKGFVYSVQKKGRRRIFFGGYLQGLTGQSLLNDPPSLPRVVRSRRRRRVILPRVPRQQPRRRTRPVSKRGQANRKRQLNLLLCSPSLRVLSLPVSQIRLSGPTKFLLPSLRPRSSPLLP